MPDDLYDHDILAWSRHQADLLRRVARGERVNDVDWEHVVEAIEDVGVSQLTAVQSYPRLLLVHLLKLRCWPDSPLVGHWRGGIVSFQADAAQRKVDLAGCPHCASRTLQRWGYASGLPRYRCGACRRSFNAPTGTPLAGLRKTAQWPAQAQALITGESLVKAAKRCDVAVTTAFRWRHRFLTAPALDKPSRLNGIVEAEPEAPNLHINTVNG